MNHFFKKIKDYKNDTLILNYGRHIIISWVKAFISSRQGKFRILDVGCGTGDDLENIVSSLRRSNSAIEPYGLEFNPLYQQTARAKGIKVEGINLEKEAFPYEDDYFDVVIINQVLEHTKEFFWIINQASRVLKNEGLLIIGVPNLAAWYNRLLLLFGRQPACIKLGSEHFRAFTRRDLTKVMTNWGGFEELNFAGSNFYPFPERISLYLSKMFPSLSVAIFLRFRKKRISNLTELVKGLPETNYKV